MGVMLAVTADALPGTMLAAEVVATVAAYVGSVVRISLPLLSCLCHLFLNLTTTLIHLCSILLLRRLQAGDKSDEIPRECSRICCSCLNHFVFTLFSSSHFYTKGMCRDATCLLRGWPGITRMARRSNLAQGNATSQSPG